MIGPFHPYVVFSPWIKLRASCLIPTTHNPNPSKRALLPSYLPKRKIWCYDIAVEYHTLELSLQKLNLKLS